MADEQTPPEPSAGRMARLREEQRPLVRCNACGHARVVPDDVTPPESESLAKIVCPQCGKVGASLIWEPR